MAILNVTLNLLSNNTIAKVTGDMKVLNATFGKTEGILSGINGKMKLLQNVQGLAAVSTVVNNVSNGLKTLTNGFKNLVGKAEGYAREGDRIAKTSRLLGLSVKDYQAFDQAAQHAGMTTEEIDGALKKFSVNLGKAKAGDSKAFKVFDSILGGKKISSYKDSSSLLLAVADGYEKLGSAEQKAFVSQELFGKSGLKMSELLGNGGEYLKSQLDSSAPGFSEKGAKDAEKFNDALQDVKKTIDGVKISVMEELFPTFTDLFKTVQNFVKENGNEIKKHLSVIIKSIADVVKKLLPRIPEILSSVVSVIDVIGPWITVIAAGLVTILPVMGQIFIGFMSIVPAIKVIVGLISGPILGYIALVIATVISWGIAIKSVYDNWDMLKSFIVDDVWSAIKDFGKKVVAIGEWIWDGFKSVFIDPWIAFFSSLPSAISDLWNGAKKVLKDFVILILHWIN